MNKSSSASSSTSSAPAAAAAKRSHLQRPITAGVRTSPATSSIVTTTHRTTPAVIPLDYDYQTTIIMSPSSFSHSRIIHPVSQSGSANAIAAIDYEQQYSSLFGEPVPPPPPAEFFGSPTHLFRQPAAQIDFSSPEDDELFGRTITLATTGHLGYPRLFSQVPYSSSSTTLLQRQRHHRNFDVLPNLAPPDIQILPNSSGDASSSDAKDSPNYQLLTPDRHPTSSALYDVASEAAASGADVSELIETVTISDATGRREYSEATRRVSNFAEDFKANVGALSTPGAVSTMDSITSPPPPQRSREDPPKVSPAFKRQFSNESYSSNEWFRPAMNDFPEFSKIPRLRPSSKNVMSIKSNEMPMHHSPVATMINDSNGSSSGAEDRLMDTTQVLEHPTVSLDALMMPPERPPSPSPSLLRELHVEQKMSERQRNSVADSLTTNLPTPPAEPPPIPPPPISASSINREMSPVIVRDSIATGGDFRVADQTRLHKKTSFSIIAEKSPKSSRSQSPTQSQSQLHSAQQQQQQPKHLQNNNKLTTPQPQQLKLPHLTHPNYNLDDSPRPSVQFNMTGRHSPSKYPQKGILQHRDFSIMPSQDTLPAGALPLPTTRQPPIQTYHPLPSLPGMSRGPKTKSYETLPLLIDPYRSSIPRLNRSSMDLRPERAVMPPGALPRPLKPNPNPTRQQRGLLRVINNNEFMAHVPPSSNWASMDDLRERKQPLSTLPSLQNRRRSSSTSPERRSSTLTASDRRSSNLSTVTTSDFSFRRPSLTPQMQRRRKSIMPTAMVPSPKAKRTKNLMPPSQNLLGITPARSARSKIAKPSTLSPIIGTPNKDSSTPQSPVHENASGRRAPSETPSDTVMSERRDSASRIPVRNQTSSRSNSRQSSHPGSRINSRSNSRSNSPLKEFTSQLPLSGRSSRATSSRPPSRAAMRNESQASSHQTPSRSASRASTRPLSRDPSQAGSRPHSRMEQARDIANSRSNSRLSMHSTMQSDKGLSPKASRKRGTTPNRRKSISLSPKPSSRRPNVQRRRSLSAAQTKSPDRRRTVGGHKRSPAKDLITRIPMRTKSNIVGRAAQKSFSSKKSTSSPSRSGMMMTKSNQSKQQVLTSAKKAPASVRKPESSVKRTPSSVKKQPSNLQKSTTGGGQNLRRETSNLQKSSPGMRREATSMSMRKAGTGGGAQSSASTRKMVPGGMGGTSAAGSTTKSTSKTATTSTKTTLTNTGSDKKQAQSQSQLQAPTTKSLTRTISKISVLSRKRSESNLNQMTAEDTSVNVTEATTTTTTTTTPSQRRKGKIIPSLIKARVLSKTFAAIPVPQKQGDSAAAAVNHQLATLGGAGASQLMAAADQQTDIPSAILEKSQKTLENVQKTVTVATDEIHKAINENLSDLKSIENDMAGGGGTSDSAASPSPSVTTVVENQTAAAGVARGDVKGTNESVSRGGTAEGLTTSSSTQNSQQTAVPDGSVQISPIPPSQPIEAKVSVLNAEAMTAAKGDGATVEAPVDSTERVSARAISVLPEVDCESANFQNYELDIDGKTMTMTTTAMTNALKSETESGAAAVELPTNSNSVDDDFKTDAKRRSPDGQGGSQPGSGGNGSREFLREPQHDSEESPTSGSCACCRCCTKFCMPCRRSRCSRCCRRGGGNNKNNNKSKSPKDESKEPVLKPSSASSSDTATHVQVVNEKAAGAKQSCWQKLNCCRSCATKKQKTRAAEEKIAGTKMTSTTTFPRRQPPKQSRCGLCLSKVFCCRSVNKVDTTTGTETEVKKCCFCIPCRRKKTTTVGDTSSATMAWQDPERGITATDASVLEGTTGTTAAAGGAAVAAKEGCCTRFWNCLLCCRKKRQIPQPGDSRRASIKAPQPPEDTRRKLHVDLVEYTSKMKGAIPVMPLFLAWFCAICNTLVPGLGTLLSGFFCLCVGIPRFSQYDSAKARFGSFIINIIVAFAQLFCVLFCFVGWGWSIWWGTIMLKCARKLNKIKKVERLEMEEEQRQAEASALAAAAARAAEAEAAPAPAAAAAVTAAAKTTK